MAADTAAPPAPLTGLRAEENFVNDFAARLEAGEVGTARGRAKAEAPAPKKEEAKEDKKDDTKKDTPKPTVAVKAGAPTSEHVEPDEASSADADEEPETTETEVEAPEHEEETPADEVDEDADEEATDDTPAEDDEKKGETPAETELAAEVRTQLEKAGLKLSLEDLPKEARPLVKARLDQINVGFTRAMMEARTYRKDEAKFRADQQFRAQHPELAIMEMLESDPELLDKVNARMTEAEAPNGKEALAIVTRDKRAEVLRLINEQAAVVDRIGERSAAIESYMRRACTKLNLPVDIVEEALANRLYEKPEADRDLTDAEIDAVIGRVQRTIAKVAGERKLEQRQAEIRGRAQDKKTISPAAKGGVSAAAPAPIGKKAPKTDDEFVSYMAAKLRR